MLTLWGGGHIGGHIWRRVIVPSDLAPAIGSPINFLSVPQGVPQDKAHIASVTGVILLLHISVLSQLSKQLIKIINYTIHLYGTVDQAPDYIS